MATIKFYCPTATIAIRIREKTPEFSSTVLLSPYLIAIVERENWE